MHRVLHLTRDFPPRHRGGLSTAVGGLVAAQARAGMAVQVISFDDWRPRRARPSSDGVTAASGDGIDVLHLGGAAGIEAAAAFAGAHRPSLLHVHDALFDDLAVELAAAGRAAIVHTVHVLHRRQNALRGSNERTLSLAAQERALARADVVIAPSRAAATALRDAYAGLGARLRVAGHGIDDSPGARAAAARHGDAPGEGPLLAVGRFADVKGTAELFAALPAIAAALPCLEVIVAGGVPANPRAERRWLERWQATASADVRRRVRFAGWLEPAALADCYSTAAAVVIPSRYESFGLVALEAMLHGVPVIASDAGAIVELVEHDRTGVLSPVGDVAALTANAVALLTDPARARRLSEAAAQHVRAHHLWEHALPAVLDAYVLGARRFSES